MSNFYEQVDANKTKSLIVVAGFFGFIALSAYFISYAFGYGPDAVAIALIFSGISSFFGYYFSDQAVLAISGARPADRKEFFDFYTSTENLSRVAGIPMPKLYVIEDSAMNAFATGRDPQHAAVCATTGLLERLNRTEIEGVIAHELSHIKNFDTRLMSLVTVMVGMITLLADMLLRWSFWGGRRNRDEERNGGQLEAIFAIVGILLALLSPIISQLIQLAISRRREFLADATGASLTKYPEGLARALEKISADTEPLEAANKATAHLYIANPLRNLKSDSVGWFANLFSTHPPVKDRIKALRG